MLEKVVLLNKILLKGRSKAHSVAISTLLNSLTTVRDYKRKELCHYRDITRSCISPVFEVHLSERKRLVNSDIHIVVLLRY